MNRKLSGAAAALVLCAGAATSMGVHVGHAASTTKQLQYADALLWPYQGGNGANNGGGNSGYSNVLWQSSNIPGGSLAILSGQGGALNYILHAKYLQPNQDYVAYFTQNSCGGNGSGVGAAGNSGNGNGSNGSGNGANGSGNTALGNYQLGRQKSNAGGAITLAGKLDVKRLPSSFVNGNGNGSGSNGNDSNGSTSFSVRVELASMAASGSSSNGSSGSSVSSSTTSNRSYCGDILTPQAVIPLKSMKGSHAQGIALISRGGNIWWKSNNTLWGSGSNNSNSTQVVTFVHGLAPNSAHEEHLHQGACSSPGEGMIEYPLTDIETNAAGDGVAGTLLNTTANILDFPSVMNNGKKTTGKPNNSMLLSLNVHGTNLQPMACGDLPYASNSGKSH